MYDTGPNNEDLQGMSGAGFCFCILSLGAIVFAACYDAVTDDTTTRGATYHLSSCDPAPYAERFCAGKEGCTAKVVLKRYGNSCELKSVEGVITQ